MGGYLGQDSILICYVYKYVEKRNVSGLVGPVSSVGNCSTMSHPLYRYQASNLNDTICLISLYFACSHVQQLP